MQNFSFEPTLYASESLSPFSNSKVLISVSNITSNSVVFATVSRNWRIQVCLSEAMGIIENYIHVIVVPDEVGTVVYSMYCIVLYCIVLY